MQWLQYRRQELVLQCHIRHEPSLLLSCFGILPKGMLQGITESLLNQTHILSGNVKDVGRPLLTGFFHHIECKFLQKFCNHGSGWLSQELSWLSVHDLTQDDIAWPYAPRKQRLSLAGSHGYSVVQTSLRASDSNKWNVSHIGCHHTCEHSCWTESCSEKRLIWENTYLSWNIAAICIRLQSCKIKSVSFQKPCNWLYFNNFKELFIHFYGTVVDGE